MARHFEGSTLIIASHNAGKVVEINDLLKEFGIKAISAAELNLPEPEETEDTYVGNAELKALAAAKGSGLPALADDSGLSVTALDGAPGIFSARWAGEPRDFNRAMDRVHAELEGKDDWSAAFVCVLSIAWPDGHVESFEGRVQGKIVKPQRGANGFGYDPIFVPDGFDITFGEMEPARKHGMSHRAEAFKRLVPAIFGTNPEC